MTASDNRRARLLWQCRRGMRELDLMLLAYVDSRYHELDAAGVQRLEQLLEYPDQVLLEVLMGRQPPADPALAELARAIRAAAGSHDG
nr:MULTISPECIES: succinate dehydrogenase assembly factor 2 [Thiohalobacter]